MLSWTVSVQTCKAPVLQNVTHFKQLANRQVHSTLTFRFRLLLSDAVYVAAAKKNVPCSAYLKYRAIREHFLQGLLCPAGLKL